MPIQCDYHMHTPLCQHASGPMEAYIERGIELGLREIGFADHNPLPNGLGANVRMTEAELDYYVQRVLDLQFMYRGRIDVKLGIEMDFVPSLLDYLQQQISRYPFDYVIGSVHYMDPTCRIGSWSVAAVAADVEGHYCRYFELLGQMAHCGLVDIVAHLDVVKRSRSFPGPRGVAAMTQALHEIKAAGICMEINTSGYRHTELPEPQPYPSLPVAQQAIALGIPLTVNSDSHAPEQVGTKFTEMESFLQLNNCRQLASFEKRKRTMYDL